MVIGFFWHVCYSLNSIKWRAYGQKIDSWYDDGFVWGVDVIDVGKFCLLCQVAESVQKVIELKTELSGEFYPSV